MLSFGWLAWVRSQFLDSCANEGYVQYLDSKFLSMHVFLRQYYMLPYLVFIISNLVYKRMYFLRYECFANIPEECIGEAAFKLTF